MVWFMSNSKYVFFILNCTEVYSVLTVCDFCAFVCVCVSLREWWTRFAIFAICYLLYFNSNSSTSIKLDTCTPYTYCAVSIRLQKWLAFETFFCFFLSIILNLPYSHIYSCSLFHDVPRNISQYLAVLQYSSLFYNN